MHWVNQCLLLNSQLHCFTFTSHCSLTQLYFSITLSFTHSLGNAHTFYHRYFVWTTKCKHLTSNSMLAHRLRQVKLYPTTKKTLMRGCCSWDDPLSRLLGVNFYFYASLSGVQTMRVRFMKGLSSKDHNKSPYGLMVNVIHLLITL